MAQNKIVVQGRRSERGQTIILVAISILSLLAMAALAVDVVTLYVAKGEIQHAADAAALAGAKAFVDSGLTSVSPLSPPSFALQGLATSMATAYVNATLPHNLVAGVAPTLVIKTIQIFNNNGYGNPYITVTLNQPTLPTFFARIWGVRFASVTATATAEAYNPSNWQTTTNISVAPKCVKPLLVSNNDPNHPGSNFVDPATGAVNAAFQVGESITLTSACNPGPCSASGPYASGAGNYLPAHVSGATSFCPSAASSSSCNSLAGPYQQSVQCCDSTVYACGGTVSNATVDTTTTAIPTATQVGLQCAIHASGNGTSMGQDTIDVSNFTSSAGPMQITQGTEPSNVPAGSFVNTSTSILTFPLINSNPAAPAVTVVGFLQVFVKQSGSPPDFDGYIVNVVGCSNATPSSPAVSGGGISPVPVRLITPL